MTPQSDPQPETLTAEKLVTVCSECRMASCWHGIFMCDLAQDAATMDLPVSELRKLDLEHPSYWEQP